MGIELRLTVLKEDMKSLYADEGRAPLFAALKDSSSLGYSQNLLVNPVVLAINAVGSLLDEYVSPQIGPDKFKEVRDFLDGSLRIRKDLQDAAVKSVSSKSKIEGLVNSHFSELQAIPGYFALLSNVDISNADEPRRGLFGIGLRGLASMVIEANEMYGPETRTQFLQYVRRGMLNMDFRNGMRIVLKSAGRKVFGKDVVGLFTEQKEAVRQALLYRREGEDGEGTCATDLLVQPAFEAHSLETPKISTYLSESGLQEHVVLATDDVASSWCRLVNALDGSSGKSSNLTARQFKMLASHHAGLLSRLTGFYRRLAEIDISGLPGNDADLFRQGMDSLLRVIVRAKAMYHPDTSAGVLQHVKASELEQPYDLGMLAAAKSIVPKTL
ncbi:hypothetical protein HYV85_01005 [Candidatus Woesearchaeota archaeon]|nr:hypothetical protein [Candidatus Woesearchaeota archaeon]